jgi:hypothetical protein
MGATNVRRKDGRRRGKKGREKKRDEGCTRKKRMEMNSVRPLHLVWEIV